MKRNLTIFLLALSACLISGCRDGTVISPNGAGGSVAGESDISTAVMETTSEASAADSDFVCGVGGETPSDDELVRETTAVCPTQSPDEPVYSETTTAVYFDEPVCPATATDVCIDEPVYCEPSTEPYSPPSPDVPVSTSCAVEPSDAIADYSCVGVESIQFDKSDNTLYVSYRNYTARDLEHIYNFTLYKDGVEVEKAETFAVCGTPDYFPLGGGFEMSYPLDNLYGELSDGTYSFSVNFMDKDKNVFSASGIFYKSGNSVCTLSGEVLYDVDYGDDGIVIKYTNETNHDMSYGLWYDLCDSDGNAVPFLDGACVIDIAYVMDAGGKNALSLNLEYMYGELPAGEYTVLHTLWGHTLHENCEGETITMRIPITI